MKRRENISVTIIGCGGMARFHVRQILTNFPQTIFPILCETSSEMYIEMAKVFHDLDRETPPNEPDFGRLIARYGDQLDAALIVTPHVYHRDQAKACLETGLDVLLEKPMVMNAAEAHSRIATRDRTKKHLVVAFQNNLSPHIQAAAKMLREVNLGEVLNISAVVWQGRHRFTDNTQRQQPKIAGGGFLFDTGAHIRRAYCQNPVGIGMCGN